MLFNRTFHPDEANQAFTTGRLLETGRYTYQPQDHHGPTLYYAAAVLQKAAGHNDTASLDGTLLRCTPLLFAVLALVFGFLAVRKLLKSAMGKLGGWLVPALFVLLLGTSPLFVFFATDFIQEMLLACFTLMMLWAGVGYLHAHNAKLKPGTWAIFFGTAAALAFATKETCVLAFGAAALAAAPFLIKRLTLDALRARMRDVVLALLSFFIIACILYSDFGRDFHGVYNAFIAAPLSYIGRAAGSASSAGAADHVHPWWQYLKWIFADANNLAFFVALGLGCGIFALFAMRPSVQPALRRAFIFLASYSLLLLLFYSLIPYKTPWCALQILIGLIPASILGFAYIRHLTASLHAERGWTPCLAHNLWCNLPLIYFAGALLVGQNIPFLQTLARNPDSKDIPYNYASASPDVKELAATVAAAVESATNHEPRTTPFIAVALPPADTWPFPWYNRPYEHQTGYWTSFDDLKALAAAGIKPTVVIVPMEEGHLVQPIFPHLKHTKRVYMRPGARSREGKMRGGVRVRVFW